MGKNETKIYYIYVIICFSFILLTTDYLSLYDIINVANQMDVISYSEISKHAPALPKDNNIIIQHVAQRFIIPYLAGSLSYFLNIDFFLVFKFFTFFFIFFYIFLINILLKKFHFNLKESILFFSLLFLNPYIVRNHIFNPVQAHDMLFFSLGLVFAYTVINKIYLINLLTVIFSAYLRQTSIALLIGSGIFLLINKKIKLFFTLCIVYFLSFFLIVTLGQQISNHKFPIHLAYGIIYYDFTQIEKLIKFLLLTMVAFFPLLVVLFGQINKNINNSTVLTLFLVWAMMIGQPIIAGPDGSTGNVVRIANLCFPILTVFIFYIWNFQKFVKNNYLFYTFVFGLFLWSLHPTFSIFKFFGSLRFYNY